MDTDYHFDRSSVCEILEYLFSPLPRFNHELKFVQVCVHICICFVSAPAVVPNALYSQRSGTVQLKCDGIGDARVGGVKWKLANGVGSQYPSHYLGTWCIQHYYR